MNFWLTTHWPNLLDSTDAHHRDIYLQDGKERYGVEIDDDDKVLFYESKSGDAPLVKGADGRERLVRRKRGAEGIVTVADVAGPLEERAKAEAIEKYRGGKTRYWRWKAPTKNEFSNGFVSRADLLRVTDQSPNYNMFGYGDGHSGLKKITADQYEELLAIFKRNPARLPLAPKGRKPPKGHWTEGGGEGPEHLTLKNYVAANPAAVFGEAGVRTHAVEFPFGTCDRADIILKDHVGRGIGVEIEVAQRDGQLDGLLQAIKYRHMLAVLLGQRFDETRAALIAYTLSDTIKGLCERYEVRWIEVDRRDVATWSARQPRGATL
ncbi:MAG TPA: hypothetical protein VEA69_25430 [Tepidisphaeraceae bacterium]|nr:hypothetical protein [Tepidisphaeraceae bacterium]